MIVANVVVVVNAHEGTVRHLRDNVPFKALPRAGDFLYWFNGIQAPHEQVFEVIGVTHHVNDFSQDVQQSTCEVMVVESTKQAYRLWISRQASRSVE